MKNSESRWRSPQVVIALVGAVLYLGYMVTYRIPDLEKRMDSIQTDLHRQINAMSVDMQGQFKAMHLALVGIRANMTRLCALRRPLDKTCNVDALVATAKNAASIQAQFFGKADVKLTAGTAPAVASKGVEKQLPQMTWGTMGVATYYPKGATKPEIANVLLWSSAADSAHWYQEGSTVRVDFTNGMASFEMKRPISQEHMTLLLDSLNSTSGAFQKVSKGIELQEPEGIRPNK